MALYFLSKGADPYIKNEKGMSAYDYAKEDKRFADVLKKIAEMKKIKK